MRRRTSRIVHVDPRIHELGEFPLNPPNLTRKDGNRCAIRTWEARYVTDACGDMSA